MLGITAHLPRRCELFPNPNAPGFRAWVAARLGFLLFQYIVTTLGAVGMLVFVSIVSANNTMRLIVHSKDLCNLLRSRRVGELFTVEPYLLNVGDCIQFICERTDDGVVEGVVEQC